MTAPDPRRSDGAEPLAPESLQEASSGEAGPDDFGALPSLVLLERMQNGEDAARDELVRRYWPRLRCWAHGRVPAGARDLYETDDVVQETMVAALGQLEGFEPEHDGALVAYLRMAILNRIRSLARHVRRRGARVALPEDLSHHGPSPLDDVIGMDVVERYERALSRLRTDDREAIHLKIELDLPYDQITHALNKRTITAARKAVSRALVRLAEEMERCA